MKQIILIMTSFIILSSHGMKRYRINEIKEMQIFMNGMISDVRQDR